MKWILFLTFLSFVGCQSLLPKKSQSQKKSTQKISSQSSDDLSLELEEEDIDFDDKEESQLVRKEQDNSLDSIEGELLGLEEDSNELLGEIDESEQEEKVASNKGEQKVTFESRLGFLKNIRFISSEGIVRVEKNNSEHEYETRYDSNKKQFILDIKNTKLPRKLTRPYVLKDFNNSSFSGFQAYQNKKSKITRIVFQMRQDEEPSVEEEGSSLVIRPSSFGSVQVSNTKNTKGKRATSLPDKNKVEKSAENQSDKTILRAKTYEEFIKIDKFYGKPISIQVRDAEIKDVLNFIGDQGKVNIVTTDQVNGKVSLKIKNTPWDQVFLTLLLTKNLGYVRRGNILFVAPLKTIIDQERETRDLIASQKEQSPLFVETIYVSFIEPSKVKEKVKSFLSPKRGNVVDDDKSGALVITDTKEAIDRVKQLIKTLDTPPRQVMIEGRIVESTESFTRGLGIDWNITGSGIDLVNLNTDIQPQSRETSGAATFSLNAGTFDYIGDLTAKLQLGETNRKARVLSAPKIVTINGESATIDQVSENIYRNSVRDETTVSDSFEAKEAKLTMTVKPQITHNSSVILNIDVTREFFGAALEGSSARPKNSRQAKTNVLVKDGQTAVIAGVYQNDSSLGKSAVPVFHHIPILGWLFKSRTRDTSKNELLIFLTPHVLKGSGG